MTRSARRRFVFAHGRQRPVHGEVVRARDQQLLGREARDHFVARFRDDDLFLDARRAPAVGGRPECFQREHHARLEFVRVIQRDQPADHRLFPDRQPDPVAELQRERRLFVREAELLRLRPHRGHLRGSAARPDQFDGGVEIFAAALVGVDHRVRRVADGEVR